jgi:Rha family phage regulatory protein
MPHNKNIKLTVINGKAITTSREVAIHFNKRHGNVLRDIENLDCSPQFNRLNFELVEYEDGKNEARKEYRITRNGFIFLAMGFTGKYAGEIKEAYIYAFDEMELELHRLRQAALQQGKPKIDDILDSAVSLEKILLEITYTKQGDVINVNKLEIG